eukprot:2872041-Prymnesium_polylepis.1
MGGINGIILEVLSQGPVSHPALRSGDRMTFLQPTPTPDATMCRFKRTASPTARWTTMHGPVPSAAHSCRAREHTLQSLLALGRLGALERRLGVAKPDRAHEALGARVRANGSQHLLRSHAERTRHPL